MSRSRTLKDPFMHSRNLAFLRSRAQAKFRGEVWELTLNEFFNFWNTIDRWNQRGRQAENLVLTRRDELLPWNTKNCVIMTRYSNLYAKNLRQRGYDDSPHFKEVIEYGQ
jgi:hypothetical protein